MLSQAERDFLTTWLLEAGMTMDWGFMWSYTYPATVRCYRSIDYMYVHVGDLVAAGYLENTHDSVYSLTQKALDELGEQSDNCPNVADETVN